MGSIPAATGVHYRFGTDLSCDLSLFRLYFQTVFVK